MQEIGTKEQVHALRQSVTGKAPATIVKLAYESFGEALVFATSLGAEDQVLTDLVARSRLPIRIVTLDTGRLFPETLDLIARTEKHYGLKIRVFFPDAQDVEELVNDRGVNLIYDSVENRKLCCNVRKRLPLRRALRPYRAWVCGLRREQSVTRAAVEVVEEDSANGLIKVNPLADWTEQQVWGYIAARGVPYNPLHDQGYASIGCACCTRAVKRTESARDGRWWWEQPEHKECGLHRGGQQ